MRRKVETYFSPISLPSNRGRSPTIRCRTTTQKRARLAAPWPLTP